MSLSVISELAHGALPPPQTEPEFTRLLRRVSCTSTKPCSTTVPPVNTDIRRNGCPGTDKCVAHLTAGAFTSRQPSKAENPDGCLQREIAYDELVKASATCTLRESATASMSEHAAPLRQRQNGAPCLFSEMAPVKLLAVMRSHAAGVHNRGGKEGRLSAYLYHKPASGHKHRVPTNRDATLAPRHLLPTSA